MAKPVKIAGTVLGVIVACAFYLLGPIPGLSIQATSALGILLGAICWWVVGILPEYVTGLIMALLFITVSGVPTETVFSTFSGSTWWLLVAAFGLGLGMKSSGLMRRMALAILRVFPQTFKSQVAGLLAAGTLVGPFIPSLSAKAAMMAPLSMSIAESMGYKPGSKQTTGLFLAMFTGLRNVGPAVISASVIGYGLVGLLPEDVAARFDMVHWLIGMLPWFIAVTVLDFAAIVFLYGPRGFRGSSSFSGDEPPCALHVESPGPMSADERRMMVIIIACVAMWVLEPLHGIPSHVVGVCALAATAACGIFTTKEFRSGIAWDSLVFIGTVLGLAEVFSYLGIDQWIVQMCQPMFESLAGNPYLFVAGIALITIALRFVIVSEMGYINIFMAFMVPLALGVGISPWVVGVTVYAVVNPWFMLYQNPIYLTAYYAVGDKAVHHVELAKFCAVYLLICIAGLMISVPYWQWMGLM